MTLAEVLHKLGAGRSQAGQPVNHSVGAELLLSVGDRVQKGAPWLRLHYDTLAPTPDQMSRLQSVLKVGSDAGAKKRLPLVRELLH
ncbi:thymidine phosphorylase-like [Salarias fasciatus]|uniref:thymidine phosphorylase-like n=1 Tax=Salarias fasciatus TaxID=181472 RepID=UPI00117689E3|nr:thymidine phosphorylase-like [Salarias fasciatus]